MKWNTLIDKNDHSIYMETLSAISGALLENAHKTKGNIGVMGGQAGIALFFFYFAKLTGEDKYVDFAHDLLSEIFAEVNDAFSIHTFSAGLAGVGWLMEHLSQNGLMEVDTDTILESLDPFLLDAMLYDLDKDNYDFLHGALGTGTYFLSRAVKPKTAPYLLELVKRLDTLKIEQENNTIAWESVLDDTDEKDVRGYNFSLSHGNASIIVYLSKLLEKGIATQQVLHLLKGAVQFILSYSLDTQKYPYNFPNWVGEKYTFGPSRLAWCYGDLGIGIALWQAAQSTGNKEWEKKALETLFHTTGRRDLQENWVRDAGLCHGAGGICHIFNRMYNYTGEPVFKDAAVYWLGQTMDMAVHKDGFAGFKTWYFERDGGWGAEPGLLGGVAGIGLMMISAISDIEPKWDRCLLLS